MYLDLILLDLWIVLKSIFLKPSLVFYQRKIEKLRGPLGQEAQGLPFRPPPLRLLSILGICKISIHEKHTHTFTDYKISNELYIRHLHVFHISQSQKIQSANSTKNHLLTSKKKTSDLISSSWWNPTGIINGIPLSTVHLNHNLPLTQRRQKNPIKLFVSPSGV